MTGILVYYMSYCAFFTPNTYGSICLFLEFQYFIATNKSTTVYNKNFPCPSIQLYDWLHYYYGCDSLCCRRPLHSGRLLSTPLFSYGFPSPTSRRLALRLMNLKRTSPKITERCLARIVELHRLERDEPYPNHVCCPRAWQSFPGWHGPWVRPTIERRFWTNRIELCRR